MAPDQPRFMDETVVVESKAVAIRARRATVHQRGSAPRHVVAATRSRLRRAGPRQKENAIGWEIDWDSCANAWTTKARWEGHSLSSSRLQARAFVQLAEDCGVMSLTSVTLPYAISALEGAGLDMNSPWSRGCHGRAHCQRVLLLTGRIAMTGWRAAARSGQRWLGGGMVSLQRIVRAACR